MNLITQTCVLFLWMHTLTSVSTQDCTLEQFRSSSLYDEHFDLSNLRAVYEPGSSVRVPCKTGYGGFYRLLCNVGRWTKVGKNCEIKHCGHPGDTPFGDFQLDVGDDYVFGSRVKYTCHKGYQIQNRNIYRNCLAQGWDGFVPTCEAQQCPAIDVDDNIQVDGDPFEATYGNVVQFRCKSSTQILVGSREIQCYEHGQWSGSAPKCKEIKCTVPIVENGFVPGEKREYNQHDVLHFFCRGKYKRSDRSSICTKVGDSAGWNPPPVCELPKCRLDLSPVVGTRFEPANKHVFVPDETVRVLCDESYWISDPLTRSIETTCNDEGEWTTRPVCKEVTCRYEWNRDVSYWGVDRYQLRKLRDAVNYICRENYKSTDGNNLARCTREGWKPNPLCQEITCDRVDIENADIAGRTVRRKYKNNAIVHYVCKEGYVGSPTRVCGETGWTGESQCAEITCNRKLDPNAHINGEAKSLYTNGEVVEYICQNGYEGRYTLTCGRRGWTKDSQCSQIRCDRKFDPNARLNGEAKSIYIDGEVVEYICQNGYEGRYTLTCGRRGWTKDSQCSLRKCKDLVIEDADIHHLDGKVTYSHNEQVQYECWGYTDIFHTATCYQGVWTGIEACSDPRDCGNPPPIDNGGTRELLRSPYNHTEKVEYLCQLFYTMLGGPFKTCFNGEWFGEIRCLIPLGCDNPPPLDDGGTKELLRSPYNHYNHTEKVEYLCQRFYTMFGGPFKTCFNGEWIGAIRCLRPCVVDSDIMREHNIGSWESLLYILHGVEIEFRCIGQRRPIGALSLRQRCYDGSMDLPTCR